MIDNFYSSPKKVRMIKTRREVNGACGAHGEDEKYYKILVGKPESKIPIGRPRRRWEDTGWKSVLFGELRGYKGVLYVTNCSTLLPQTYLRNSKNNKSNIPVSVLFSCTRILHRVNMHKS
jgi:hypothetical protein